MLQILKRMQAIESRGRPGQADSAENANIRVLWLFLIVVAGILASWFWEIGWEYLADTTQPIRVGPALAVVVRVILSFIAAAVSFANMYTKINQNTQESWIPYFLAFQNGFFWDAIFQGIAQSFSSSSGS